MKHLVKKFGLNDIQKEILKHNWTLPSARQIRGMDIDYDVVWVSDVVLKQEDRETHGYIYNTIDDKLELCNKSHMHNIVVIKGKQMTIKMDRITKAQFKMVFISVFFTALINATVTYVTIKYVNNHTTKMTLQDAEDMLYLHLMKDKYRIKVPSETK